MTNELSTYIAMIADPGCWFTLIPLKWLLQSVLVLILSISHTLHFFLIALNKVEMCKVVQKTGKFDIDIYGVDWLENRCFSQREECDRVSRSWQRYPDDKVEFHFEMWEFFCMLTQCLTIWNVTLPWSQFPNHLLAGKMIVTSPTPLQTSTLSPTHLHTKITNG